MFVVNTHIHIYIYIYSHRPKDESARRIVRLAGVADRKLRRHGSTIARVDSYCYRYRKRPIHPIAKLNIPNTYNIYYICLYIYVCTHKRTPTLNT